MVPVAEVEIFFSYSHKDEKLRDRLATHLSQLKNERLIRDWHDRRITAGTEWEGKIDQHLNSAHIILLLVSSDFLASKYCHDVEVKRAMERHEAGEARVIPVILRPCDWQTAPFGRLQALPKDGRAITTWSNRDAAFTDVAKGIRLGVKEVLEATKGDNSTSILHTRDLTRQDNTSCLETRDLNVQGSVQHSTWDARRPPVPWLLFDLSKPPAQYLLVFVLLLLILGLGYLWKEHTGGITGTFGDMGEQSNRQDPSLPGKLELIDVSYSEQRKYARPKIEVKVKNTEKGVAFIKRAIFHVKKIYFFQPFTHIAGGYVPPSAEYPVQLPGKDGARSESVNIAHRVEYNKVDRFSFEMIPPKRSTVVDIDEDPVYLLRLELNYNSGQVLNSNDMLFVIRTDGLYFAEEKEMKEMEFRQMYVDPHPRLLEHNMKLTAELSKTEAVKNKPLLDLLKGFERYR